MAMMVDIMGSVSDPTSIEEAMSDSTWKEMMLVIYDNITKNATWALVKRPWNKDEGDMHQLGVESKV